MLLARLWVRSLGLAVFCLVVIAIVLPGCTSQPTESVSDDAVTSIEPAKPQSAPADAPQPMEEVVREPSDDSSEPTQVSETPAAPVETPKPQQNPTEQLARDENNGREYRTVFYRADANQPPTMPSVVLSKGHEALCRLKVGDTMPDIDLEQLGGGRRKLADVAGKKATVVVFWKPGRRMADQQLADLGPDVIEPFGKAGIAVVGIAVGESPAKAQAALEHTGGDFPTLLDADGKAFAQVGSEKLPRTFLLDPQGKILWFDIEYSLSTRRELHQALRVVTGEQAESNGN
jgi:peroxiredoxin